MNTMNSIVWLVPIIFMLHDFEEIIMAEVWGERYKKAICKAWPKHQPFGLNLIHYCKTPAFSLGVEIIFVLYLLISLFSLISQNYFIWYSALLGLTLHLVFIHMFLCIRFKHYIPGLITSIIFLFPNIWLLIITANILNYGINKILLSCLLGNVLIAIISPMHKFIGRLSILLYKYSEISEK